MLTPAYLEGLPAPILALYEQAELDILQNMAERIAKYDYWIPAADWQNLKLKEAGRMQEEILRILAAASGKTEAELRALMEKATTEGLRSDRSVYEAHGETVPPFSEREALVNTLNAGYRATRQTMRNLTRTTANTATQQFERALDRAWLQVRSGGFSYDQAVTNAVKELAARGVESIRYPSGHTDTIETAVRRAVVTGINQTTLQLQDVLAEEMDCDLVEVSAHAGARPSHAVWQGKVYSRSGQSKKYPKLSTATGYGTGDGLGGWNCRHNMHPWYEGSPRAYSEEQLEKYNAKTVTYNGEKMTEYEASQLQRKIERSIRKWKREYAALAAAGQDTGPAAAKLKAWREKERDFLAQTGLKQQRARSQVAGVTAAGKKVVANFSRTGIMGEPKEKEGVDVRFVGRINVATYRCVAKDITTDEVIITEERIKHIMDHHPGDYEKYSQYIKKMVEHPQYIIRDADPNTAIVLQEFSESGEFFRLVMKLTIIGDEAYKKNSIITFLRISEKTFRKYLRNKDILYKAE